MNESNKQNTEKTPVDAEWHSFLAGQLRNCYHLYRGVADDGIDPPQLPADLVSIGFGDRSFVNTIVGTAPTAWDQSDGWDTAGFTDPARGLTAAELVATLGTVQSCPFELSDRCAKPPLDKELRPDIAGALSMTNYDTALGVNSNVNGVPLDNRLLRAYRSPGMFPPALNAIDWYNFFFEAPIATVTQDAISQVYDPVPTSGGRQIIVLHRPPSAADANRIRSIVGETLWGATIVYMPTTREESLDGGQAYTGSGGGTFCDSITDATSPVERIRCAYTVRHIIDDRDETGFDLELAISSPFLPKLYVLSPYNRYFTTDHTGDATPGPNCEINGYGNDGSTPLPVPLTDPDTFEDERFAQYWRHLNEGGGHREDCESELSAIQLANDIFDRLTSHELRL